MIRLTTPTEYLTNPELPQWSRNERDAARFDEYRAAIDCVLSRDIVAGRELGVTWDVIKLSIPLDDGAAPVRESGTYYVDLAISRTRTR